MKKMFYITSVIVIACVIASSMIASVTSSPPDDGTRGDSDSVGTQYILTVKDDRLVAYAGESDRPYIETDTAVSSLPRDIQVKLKAGIKYYSEKELRAAVDEYCS